MAHFSRLLQSIQNKSFQVGWLRSSYTAHRDVQYLRFSTCRHAVRCLQKTVGRGAAAPFHPYTRTVSHRAAAFDSASLEMKDDHLLIGDKEGEHVKVPYYWLRDNCRCSACFHPGSFQIMHNIADLDLDIKATDVQSDSSQVTITWSDCHKSEFSHSWLREHSPGGGNVLHDGHDVLYRTLWQGSRFKMPSFQLSDLFNDKPTLKTLLRNLHEYGVALIGGVETSSEAHADVAELVGGGIQATFYSPLVSDASPGLEIADTAYTTVAIPLHTDTTYFSPPCRGMTLQITEHSGEGGSNVLSDGFNALERLRVNNPEYFKILCNTPVTAHYVDEERNIRNCEPVVKINSNTNQIERLRFNPLDRATVTNIPYEDMLSFYKAYQTLAKEIYNDDNAYKILLKPDQLVIYDNWRVLHARESFTGYRVLKVAYLRHDDWMSQMRKIGGLEV